MPTFKTSNGPIKISFFEVLGGTPRPRTRSKKVVSAPVAAPPAPPTPAPAAEPTKPEDKPAEEVAKPAEEAAKPADPAPEEPKEPTFTADEDANLLKYKGDNKSWKEISVLMDGKAIYQLKNRFKELKITESAEKKAAEKAEAEKKEEEAKKEAAKEVKAKEKQEKKEKKQKEKKESTKPEETEKATEVVKEKVVYVHATDKFTKDELIFMNGIAQRWDGKKWVDIASRLFDKNGKRVEPSDVKEGLDQLPK
ncbi:MAG: hypothetical protein M1835_006835 [Candelina submexicana]|nr:MAG: hypothetical protein M1835_006835 [Candelina submexicana]